MAENYDGLVHLKRVAFIEAKASRRAHDKTVEAVQAELDREIERVKTEHAQKHAEFLQIIKDADEWLVTAETDLRDQLKEWHEASGEKTYDANLSVRVNTTLEYDKTKATAWAKDNAPFILVVDEKQFKDLDIARTLDFVTVKENVVAVIKGL